MSTDLSRSVSVQTPDDDLVPEEEDEEEGQRVEALSLSHVSCVLRMMTCTDVCRCILTYVDLY
jgi:hypothetical protein